MKDPGFFRPEIIIFFMKTASKWTKLNRDRFTHPIPPAINGRSKKVGGRSPFAGRKPDVLNRFIAKARFYIFPNSMADLHSKTLDAPPPPGPIFFVFLQFAAKFGQILIGWCPLLWNWSPPSYGSANAICDCSLRWLCLRTVTEALERETGGDTCS